MTAVDGSYIPGTTSGPYPARPGNRVRAIVDGPQIMRRIGKAIANARHSVWLTAVARDLRCRLFARHLGIDTAPLDDRAALRQFRDIARGNRLRLESRAPDWQGLAFALSPETYARKSGVKPDLT